MISQAFGQKMCIRDRSWVAWGLGYTKVASKDFLKYSIPTVWISGILCCAAVYLMYGSVAFAA